MFKTLTTAYAYAADCEPYLKHLFKRVCGTQQQRRRKVWERQMTPGIDPFGKHLFSASSYASHLSVWTCSDKYMIGECIAWGSKAHGCCARISRCHLLNPSQSQRMPGLLYLPPA